VPNETVATLLHAADARACVAAGARPPFKVRHHDCVEALVGTLQTTEVAVAVIDASDAACRSMASPIAAIRYRFPTVPILAYCSVLTAGASSVVDVVRAGATGLILRGIDDERHAMRAAIDSARRGSISQRVQNEVALHLPSQARPFLRYAVTRFGDEPSVEDAARTIGVDRKTIFNWLRHGGGVGPREFLNWIRLAIAAGMLEDPGRSAEQAALEAGFASGAAFRNMLHRYTGLTCSQIRGTDGSAKVLGALVSALAQETEVPTIYRMPMPDAEMRPQAQTRRA
jgi:AraC-like DNA-binding protein